MVAISFSKNQKIIFNNIIYTISRVVNLNYLIARQDETGELEKLKISDIKPYINSESLKKNKIDLTEINEKNWALANKRFEIIKSLIELGSDRKKHHVEALSALHNVSVPTLYRWVKKYEESGKVSSLVRHTRKDKNSSRLSPEQQLLLKMSIETHFLKPERPLASVAYMNYKVDCSNSQLVPCSYKTYLRKIDNLIPQIKAEQRYSKSAARQKHEPKVGKFPQGRFPLDVVQIDHTKPNVILVDDLERKPIGRPWVTFAIDIYSRMILGFYLSLEAPSATSVALCLTHAINRKDSWLKTHNIDTEWPCWGMMRVLHADNGPDFRSKSLDQACNEYQIQLNWRPLGRPDFGGHVERLMRTVKVALNDLKGTTFMNHLDKHEYDSEGHAIFTFSELQKWLVTYITQVYHMQSHSALNTSPLAKFEDGLFNGTDTPSLGLPEVIENEKRLYLDFLPYKRRTVQTYGIALDNINYFHPAITKWVGVNSSAEDGKFTIKYELHQINHVFFLDPDTSDYIEIPRVQRTASNMTRFELKKVRNYLKQQGANNIDENAIIEAHRKLNEIASSAANKTKAQRRFEQRKKQAKVAVSHTKDKPKVIAQDELWEDVVPFDNLDLDI